VIGSTLRSLLSAIGKLAGGSGDEWLVNLETASYDTVSRDISPQVFSALSLAFSADGQKLYASDNGNDNIEQFSLSDAWDLSTASYDSVTLDVTDGTPRQMAFSPEGLKMVYIGGSDDRVYQYNLSTPWDLSSATSGGFLAVSAQDSSPTGVAFNADGSKMFVCGGSNSRIYQYNLPTPYSLSSASYDSISFSVNSQDTFPVAIAFSPDGTKLYVLGNTSDRIHQYTLSTAWDLTTAGYDSLSFLLSSQDSSPLGFAFSSNGSKFFMLGINEVVYQYSGF